MFGEYAFNEQLALRVTSWWSMLDVIIDRVPTAKEILLAVQADGRGVFTEGKPLVTSDQIRDGYVRPAREAQVSARYFMEAQPLAVELTTDQRIWVFKVNDMGQATRLMSALGLKVRVVEPTYAPPIMIQRNQRFKWKAFIGLILIISIFAALGRFFR
jgi:hypothetical protein